LITLRVRHRTEYRYQTPVSLGPHRLMLRPRESRDVRVLSNQISVTPSGALSWGQDVFGNALATVAFAGSTDQLTIEAVSELQLHADEWPVFAIAASAIVYPFQYSSDEATDLGALAIPHDRDPSGRLETWARGFVRGATTDTLALLKDLSAGLPHWISYQSRDDEGTQTPVETLDRGWGSCRDFAVLFAEAARSLGFAARIVSGYLFDPGQTQQGLSGAGSTHAWAEVFVSGAGWISFDPTNGGVGGSNLIPVGVGRHIGQISPVIGSYVGAHNPSSALSIAVSVERIEV
jgi:transglutaminase-like putative cysteine protease